MTGAAGQRSRFTGFKSPMFTLWSDGPRQIRQSVLRNSLLAKLLPSAPMYLRHIGEQPGPHLIQVRKCLRDAVA